MQGPPSDHLACFLAVLANTHKIHTHLFSLTVSLSLPFTPAVVLCLSTFYDYMGEMEGGGGRRRMWKRCMHTHERWETKRRHCAFHMSHFCREKIKIKFSAWKSLMLMYGEALSTMRMKISRVQRESAGKPSVHSGESAFRPARRHRHSTKDPRVLPIDTR